MKGFFTKQHVYLLYQLALVGFLISLVMLAVGFPSLSLGNAILFGLTLFIVILGLSFGLVMSIGFALVVLFLFGSLQLWSAFAFSSLLLSIKETIYWMLAFIAAAILAGLYQSWLSTLLAENKEMNEKFADLVTIDATTGFDNGKRFLLEVQGEHSRAFRTKVPFSLLLIKILFFDEFRKLYGQQETSHLLASIAQIIFEHTRINDRKFRFSEDTFALILPNTVGDNVDIVLNKIEAVIKEHRLANKQKIVSLTIAFGRASYHEDVIDYMELVEHAQNELEQYVQ